MSRIVRSGLVVFALLLSLFVIPAAAGAAPGDGNSAAAQMCQQGGDANLVGVSGGQVVTFKNVGDCVSFASQGGQLVLRSMAQPCLNGGYSDWLTEAKVAFTSQAECVAYVGNGGTLQPKSVADLVVTTTRQPSSMLFVVAGTGFLPNTPIDFTFVNSDGYNITFADLLTTDNDGSFSDTFIWGCNAPREGTVTVTDGTNTASETYPICH